MNYKLIVSGVCVFISSWMYAQSESKKEKNFHKTLYATTTMQINQLKNGALLVRLKTNALALEALRKSGKEQQANALERNQAEINRNILEAFQGKFKFCSVYFFFSNYSEAVKNKTFDRVVFLNDNLQPDSTIKFTKGTFLVADFGVIEQDTARYAENTLIIPDDNFSVKQSKTYYGGPSFGYEGLIIRSDALVQLRHPFPYFVRTYDSKLKKKVVNHAVRKMNKKLNHFYNKRSV